MPRIVRCSLIQATNAAPPDSSLADTKKAMLDKHVAYIEQAARAVAQIVCLQELFNSTYFCKSESHERFNLAEPIPGPTVEQMQELAKELAIVLIVRPWGLLGRPEE